MPAAAPPALRRLHVARRATRHVVVAGIPGVTKLSLTRHRGTAYVFGWNLYRWFAAADPESLAARAAALGLADDTLAVVRARGAQRTSPAIRADRLPAALRRMADAGAAAVPGVVAHPESIDDAARRALAAWLEERPGLAAAEAAAEAAADGDADDADAAVAAAPPARGDGACRYVAVPRDWVDQVARGLLRLQLAGYEPDAARRAALVQDATAELAAVGVLPGLAPSRP